MADPHAGALRSPQLQMAGLFLLLALFVFYLGLRSRLLAEMVGLAAVVGTGFVLFRSKARLAVAPAGILGGALAALGIIGYLVWPRVSGAGGVSADVQLNSEESLRTLRVFLLAGEATLIGGLLARPNTKVELSSQPHQARGRRRNADQVLALFSLLTAIIAIIGMGFANFITRSDYLGYPGGYPNLIRVSSFALVVGFTAAAALSASSTFGPRSLGWGLLAAIAAVFISQGSRRLALVPLLFLVGRFVAGRQVRARGFALSLAVSIYMLQLPLVFRSWTAHGLFPHLNALTSYSFGSSPLRRLAANVLFGFPLSGYVTTQVSHLPRSYLTVALDPRPGSMAGWYQIAPMLRVNTYTPYSAVGELANQGLPVVFLYFLGLGVIFTVCARAFLKISQASQSLEIMSAPSFVVLLAAAGYIALLVTQYNLRSATRIVYLVAVVGIVSAINQQLVSRIRKQRVGYLGRSSVKRPHLPIISGSDSDG